MNVSNGQIVELTSNAFLEMSQVEQSKYKPIMRDLTKKEKLNHQIKLYSPCGCGSGKKFKFCCFKK